MHITMVMVRASLSQNDFALLVVNILLTALLSAFSPASAGGLQQMIDSISCSDQLIKMAVAKFTTDREPVLLPPLTQSFSPTARGQIHKDRGLAFRNLQIQAVSPSNQGLAKKIFDNARIRYEDGDNSIFAQAHSNGTFQATIAPQLQDSLFDWMIRLHELQHIIQFMLFLEMIKMPFTAENSQRWNPILESNMIRLYGFEDAFRLNEDGPMRVNYEFLRSFDAAYRQAELEAIGRLASDEGKRWFSAVLMNVDKPFELWLKEDWFSGHNSFEAVIANVRGLGQKPLEFRQDEARRVLLIAVPAMAFGGFVLVPILVRIVQSLLNSASALH